MPLTIQFAPVSGVAGDDGRIEIPIVDLITVATPKAYPTFGNSADQIWKYDPEAGWIKYWYRSANKNWVRQNAGTSTTTDTVKSGDTVMFRRGNGAAATTITLSGAVRPFEAVPTYSGISAGFSQFVGYPWPVEFDAITLPLYQKVGPKAYPTFGNSADQIWTYDAEKGWQKYWYRTAGKTYRLQGSTADATTIPIAAGEGFMFRRGNGAQAETIEFTYPPKTTKAD